ncbi:hypothetical protein Sp245p_03545 [Azospirillum baldaniorum]|uniref:Uncharacterized protein n=1 Tax=Azospirillum baldaniorum TaxID=1064539 RepID=A0A9P1JTA0_9PROT|nr:hypothetical protein [Azospirillum baldaniorum]AWJ88928.1 hypothetical protein Sp245p_03545 [Azospirillum baldaniorum]TWA73360.1 hypothetical protein FBZ85_11652 [Azospirillum brasilense]CCC99359.1 protein of unknown function [Azospirillum baldaniorum]
MAKTADTTDAQAAPDTPTDAPAPPALVKVACISTLQPWVNNAPMDFKGAYEVSEEDAALLESKDFVVRLG